MSEWVYFSERKPVENDCPIEAAQILDSCGQIGVELFHVLPPWSVPLYRDYYAWRSIGPLPKPVDEGERLADEHVGNKTFGTELQRAAARHDFLAGYQAGLKKGKG